MINNTKDIDQEIEEKRIRLTSRWQSDKSQDILANVIAALQSRQPWAHFLSELPDFEGVEWDLRGAPLAGINFAGADFKEVNLYFSDLSGANLELCDFRGATLFYANLSDANLAGANFEGCRMMLINLSRANLSNAELMRAVLAGGNLVEANFSGADLTGATLLGAKLEGTVFDGAILQDGRWGELAKESSSPDTGESESLEDIQIPTTDTDGESPELTPE
jgi:uncharacterized protein YjbI with pentapeptide repeats